MKNKIFKILTLIIVIFSSIIVPKINAVNTGPVSIQNTQLKAGEKTNVFIDLRNISYNISKITLTTDIYLEGLVDYATGTGSDSFDLSNKTFTITSIATDTISVIYDVPSYMSAGTKINIVVIISDDTDTEQVHANFEIEIIDDESKNQNGMGNNQQDNQSDLNNQSVLQNSRQTNGLSGMSYSGTTETVKYNGSRNNYLQSLTVSGYDLNFEFNKTNNTYFITVPSDVTSIGVTTVKEDSTATISTTGNTNLQSGVNKILISVLAENGDIRNYRIYVTREV